MKVSPKMLYLFLHFLLHLLFAHPTEPDLFSDKDEESGHVADAKNDECSVQISERQSRKSGFRWRIVLFFRFAQTTADVRANFFNPVTKKAGFAHNHRSFSIQIPIIFGRNESNQITKNQLFK